MSDVFDPTAAPVPSSPPVNEPPRGFDPGTANGSTEEIEVDFSATSDDFENLDDGWYLFAVASATARDDNGGPLLSESGNAMIKWEMRVVEGPRANSPMWLRTVTKGKGSFSLRRFINQAFGSKLEKTSMRLALGPFIGKQFWARVGFQRDSDQYKEFKEYRPVNNPPAGVVAGNLPDGIGAKI